MIWPGNKTLVLSRYRFDCGAENKDTLRGIHLSDLQGASFGENNIELLKRISDVRPHLIVFSGDLVDRRMRVDTDFEAVIDFMKRLREIAPTFFLYGNHELAFFILYPGILGSRRQGFGLLIPVLGRNDGRKADLCSCGSEIGNGEKYPNLWNDWYSAVLRGDPDRGEGNPALKHFRSGNLRTLSHYGAADTADLPDGGRGDQNRSDYQCGDGRGYCV